MAEMRQSEEKSRRKVRMSVGDRVFETIHITALPADGRDAVSVPQPAAVSFN